jgi:hypothetical protein
MAGACVNAANSDLATALLVKVHPTHPRFACSSCVRHCMAGLISKVRLINIPLFPVPKYAPPFRVSPSPHEGNFENWFCPDRLQFELVAVGGEPQHSAWWKQISHALPLTTHRQDTLTFNAKFLQDLREWHLLESIEDDTHLIGYSVGTKPG